MGSHRAGPWPIAGVALFAAAAAPAQQMPTATAEMKDPEGNPVGTVTLTQMPQAVVIRAELRNLPAGPHGFHIHQTGRCEPPFESAGDHFNPDGKQHGFGANGMHAGDLPNVHVGADGAATVELVTTEVSLAEPQVAAGAIGEQDVTTTPMALMPDPLFDGDGAAIVVHAQADDYTTDPSGNTGDRIACGVLDRQ